VDIIMISSADCTDKERGGGRRSSVEHRAAAGGVYFSSNLHQRSTLHMRTNIVIDTSAWIDCFTGAPFARAARIPGNGRSAEWALRARISEKARAPEQ